jgi:hypothetical protein
MNPKTTIVVSLVSCGLLIAGNDLLHNHTMPSYREVLGVGVAFAVISLGAEVAPDFAAMFALLILVTVFLETGGTLAPELTAFFSGGQKGTKKV